MTVIPLEVRRRRRDDRIAMGLGQAVDAGPLTPPPPSPFTAPPNFMLARSEAEELLVLATGLAAIHRTYSTRAGLDRAEAIKRRMRLILRSPS